MPIIHAIVLGIVQGLSEFLPISSSGHLILVPELFHWTELTDHATLNKTFDVALHFGTLIGAVAYLRRDVWKYICAALRSIRVRSIQSTDARVAWLLLLATIPGAAIGALFESPIDDHLGQPVLIGVMLILGAFILWWADQSKGRRVVDSMSTRDAVIVGTAQAIALQPGISRSGITMSAARWLGFSRDESARLSFLMLIPIVAGASLYKGTKMFANGGIPAGFGGAFFWGIVSSAITGWIAVFFMLKFLRTHSFFPFVVYRVIVGVAVIIVFGTGIR
ncbi:MAG: putative bacitracin resistance protein [Actinomycetia bacterium]|nr:putative bacitracin resistance protein [Actinomycetes bacterium]